MVGYAAFRIDSARSSTRIDAFVTDTTLVTWTVVVQNAFRSTRAVRITDVIRRTDARNSLTLLPAFRIGSARMSITRTRFGDIWFD